MNAVHVTVNGVLVRRNNPQQEDFIEAPEVSGYMRPFFVDFFLPFFFVGTYFFHPIQMFQTLPKMASYWKSSVSILEEVGITEDLLR